MVTNDATLVKLKHKIMEETAMIDLTFSLWGG